MLCNEYSLSTGINYVLMWHALIRYYVLCDVCARAVSWDVTCCVHWNIVKIKEIKRRQRPHCSRDHFYVRVMLIYPTRFQYFPQPSMESHTHSRLLSRLWDSLPRETGIEPAPLWVRTPASNLSAILFPSWRVTEVTVCTDVVIIKRTSLYLFIGITPVTVFKKSALV